MKLKHLKRFLDSFDNEEGEVFIKLKSHYDPGGRLPFSEEKLENLQEKFRKTYLDFDCVNFILTSEHPLSTEE